MYTFIRAIAVASGPNQRWKEVDISQASTSTLFTQYREIYAVVSHPLVQNEMTINLADIAADLQANAGTISDYLRSIGDKNLPTVAGEPVIVRNNAIFCDAFEAGFSVQSVDYTVGDGVVLPEELKPHLVVTTKDDPDDYDYLTFRKKVLANVNGFYHRTAANSKGYYVIDGNKARLKSSHNFIGLLSFATFGEMDLVDIAEDHLSFETNADTGLVDRVRLKFDDQDLVNKTPILFLGGYMVLIDGDTLLQTNTNVLSFKTLKYPFYERYFESVKELDFSAFDPVHIPSNPDWVELNAFRREAYLRKYFTMNQSFLVLVDTQTLVTDRLYPETQSVPHTFLFGSEPKWPLVVAAGKHEVYWKQQESGVWIITGHDTFKPHYMAQTTPSSELVAIDNVLFMANAGRYGDGYFLKLIDEEIQIKTA